MATKRIVLLLAITALLIAATSAPALALLANGQAAPNFQLTDLSGTSHTLSQYRGKVVVIDFFGYACGYCQDDAKNTLVPLYNSYFKNDPNVQFLGVEIDGGSISQDQAFVQITGAPWPILQAGSSGVASAYQVVSTPTVYVISPAGTVASSSVYPTDAATLRSTIDSLEGSSTPASSPAACALSPSSVALFVKGTDGALWWKHGNGATWSAATSLGGVITSDPAATSPSAGAIDVFVRGTDGALWTRSTTNGGTSWSSWSKNNGQLLAGTSPAACTLGSRIDIFVTGTDNALWHTWTGQTGWQSLGGKLTSSPAAASPSADVIDAFVRGTDGALWQKAYAANAWEGWKSLGGQIPAGTGPAACSWGAGRLDVFVQGSDAAMWHKSYAGSWSGWQSLGGILTSSPAATSPNTGVIDAFVRGSNPGLWEKTYNGGWSGWSSISGI
jgi:peroxiredoxin